MASLHPRYRVSTGTYVTYNVFGLGVCLWGLSRIYTKTLPEELAAAGPWQFLTNLSLALTCITIVANVTSCVTGVSLLKHVSVVLTAAALVAETLVSLIYWTLKLFFLKMILHEAVKRDGVIPWNLDIAIHLFPVCFLSIDYHLFRPTGFNLPFPLVLSIVVTLAVLYWNILEALVKPPALYPYPFLNVEREQRMLVFVGVAVLGAVFYLVYEACHKLVAATFFATKEKTN